jgi:hypothetical protein
MILWTIQHVEAWQTLQRREVLLGDMRRAYSHFRPAYRWLKEQQSLRRPPIWAWYSYNAKRKKPDLRCTGHLERGEHGVCIEFEAPDGLVTLSRFDLWHSVLNDAFLSEDEQHDLDNPTPEQKRQSWRHIFDLNFGDPAWHGPPDEAWIQATIPYLQLEWVRSHQHFKAR